MINNVVLTGRLTADPQVRQSPSTKVARFSLAVNRRFARNGEQQTDFINCVVFGKTAEFVEQYFTKGMMIGLEGRIQTGSYDDKETGKKVYTTDVIGENVHFLESRRSQENQGNYSNNNYGYNPNFNTQNEPINYQNNNFGYNSTYSNTMNQSQSENDFGNESVEIASDDLPF